MDMPFNAIQYMPANMPPRSKEINPPNEMPESEQHTNAIQEEPVEEETTTTDVADAWAVAEGYTPLSDLNHGGDGGPSYVMVSTGPMDSSSDSDEEGTAMQATSMQQGSFYVNPNLFGTNINSDADAYNDTSLQPTLDFDEIAASALSALDEEYQQTQVQPLENTSNTKQDDDDLKIIAAGFDELNQELKEIRQQGGFVCQQEWDEKPQSQQKPPQRKNNKNVDTDAVRKAVETLTVKNKDNPFQQKFAAWQQNQQLQRQKEKEEEPHKLIPTTAYNIFQESNPTSESRLASANLSRSATLAEALVRLSLLPRDDDDDDDDDNDDDAKDDESDFLLIDIVGVDHVECESKDTIRNTFRPLVQWLGDYFLAANHTNPTLRVHFRLIGRELFTTTNVVDLMDSDSSRIKATATCHSGVYHEFLEEMCKGDVNKGVLGDSGDKRVPDLAVAFNAGIWGYREWAETIQYLASKDYTVTEGTSTKSKTRGCGGLPMVITAYTLDECQEDQEVISQSITGNGTDTSEETVVNVEVSKPGDSYQAEILWESEPNPFGSKVVRETKGSTQEYRENACWQAWLLGGKK